MPTNALVNIEGLTKPATVLIEKVSEAVGGIFRPYQIVRVAKAKAEAESIRSEAQIEITDLERRAFQRWFIEEGKKQANIEEITRKALPLLEDNSAPESLDDDWITNFFDKCRIVSDTDMQQLWSRVLAQQANVPGAFSKQTVNHLADLEKTDAELFMGLCSFGWQISHEFVPLVFDTRTEIYNHQGITFNALSHLQSLGLIRFDQLSGFKFIGLPKKPVVSYYGNPLELTLPKDAENELKVGKVLLTRAGGELASICKPDPIEGFFDFVYEKWVSDSLISREETEQNSLAHHQEE